MAFAPPFQRPFSATFDRRAAAAAASNGLLNSLIAYWPGNEASGNLLDAHTNALHLTDTNTVTNAAGKVYATARQYTAANSERHIQPADEALLSAGDVDMTLVLWCYMDTKSSDMFIAGKWQGATNGREYILSYALASDRFAFTVRNTVDTTSTSRLGDSLGSPSVTAWYLVIGWHDATNNQIGIQINNGVADVTTGYTGGIRDGALPFVVGSNFIENANNFNGRIGPVAMWKSAAGGGGVLSAAQRTALYNGGAGLAYAAFTT